MKEEYKNLRIKYPKRVPVVIKEMKGCTLEKKLEESKYLVPDDLSVAHFIFILRKRLDLEGKSEVAIFLFVHKEGTRDFSIPTASKAFSEIFSQYGFADGHLPMYYATENTFG